MCYNTHTQTQNKHKESMKRCHHLSLPTPQRETHRKQANSHCRLLSHQLLLKVGGRQGAGWKQVKGADGLLNPPLLLPAQRGWALFHLGRDRDFTLESLNREGLDSGTPCTAEGGTLQGLRARNTRKWISQMATLPAPFPPSAFRPPWSRLNPQAGDWRIPLRLRAAQEERPRDTDLPSSSLSLHSSFCKYLSSV